MPTYTVFFFRGEFYFITGHYNDYITYKMPPGKILFEFELLQFGSGQGGCETTF